MIKILYHRGLGEHGKDTDLNLRLNSVQPDSYLVHDLRGKKKFE